MPMYFTSLHLCVFRIGSGGWSTEGVTRDTVSQSENSTVVQCNSTHLTSFAVLVSVAGSQVSATCVYYTIDDIVRTWM